MCKDKDLLHCKKQLLPKFYWKNPSTFKYITLMGDISSKKKLSRLVSVFSKGIIINVKTVIAHNCYTYTFELLSGVLQTHLWVLRQ